MKEVPRRRNRAGGRIARSAPWLSVGSDHTQVADVIRGADRGEMPKLFIDVTLPKIRGFKDMHVAVENFKAVLGHGLPRIQLFKSFKTFKQFKPCELDPVPKNILYGCYAERPAKHLVRVSYEDEIPRLPPESHQRIRMNTDTQGQPPKHLNDLNGLNDWNVFMLVPDASKYILPLCPGSLRWRGFVLSPLPLGAERLPCKPLCHPNLV